MRREKRWEEKARKYLAQQDQKRERRQRKNTDSPPVVTSHDGAGSGGLRPSNVGIAAAGFFMKENADG
jgi:hypothetical protein